MFVAMKKLSRGEERTYDGAVNTVRETLGSYEGIASLCFSNTGISVSSNTIRRWFSSRKIPIEYAALFSELTFGSVSVYDFFPWLDLYT